MKLVCASCLVYAEMIFYNQRFTQNSSLTFQAVRTSTPGEQNSPLGWEWCRWQQASFCGVICFKHQAVLSMNLSTHTVKVQKLSEMFLLLLGAGWVLPFLGGSVVWEDRDLVAGLCHHPCLHGLTGLIGYGSRLYSVK